MSLLFLLGMSTGIRAQYINVVCAGEEGIHYRVQGTEGSTFEWRVEGGTIVSDWGDSISVDWGNSSGEYEIWVQETSRYGCPALPVSGTVRVTGPEFDLGEDHDICEGESVEIEAPSGYDSYLWNDGSTGTSIITRTEGYRIVTVSNEYGCSLSDSVYISVHPLPVVDLGQDTSLCGNEELLLDAGPDGVYYNWSSGNRDRYLRVYEGQGAIWVQVTGEFDCSANDTIEIEACQAEERLKGMPTAFTPNGDGKNDVWRIPQLEPFPAAVVEIYDRWGNLVYKSDPGYSTPWDGVASNGRTMPMDTYYFVIDLGDDKSKPIVGSVTIIK